VDPTQPNPWVNPTHGQLWSRLGPYVFQVVGRQRASAITSSTTWEHATCVLLLGRLQMLEMSLRFEMSRPVSTAGVAKHADRPLTSPPAPRALPVWHVPRVGRRPNIRSPPDTCPPGHLPPGQHSCVKRPKIVINVNKCVHCEKK